MGTRIMDINRDTAVGYLRTYTDSRHRYAWPLYDDDPSPGVLSGADLTAPALLSYSISGTHLNEMGRDPEPDSPNPYRELYEAMATFVAVEDGGTSFAEVTEAQITELTTRTRHVPVDGPESWTALVACLDAVQRCRGLTTVAVTKILHRKRPDLVPINDSKVREFFGVPHDYPKLFATIHAEVSDADTMALLNELAAPHITPGGRTMSPLRALDIIAWMDVQSR